MSWKCPNPDCQEIVDDKEDFCPKCGTQKPKVQEGSETKVEQNTDNSMQAADVQQVLPDTNAPQESIASAAKKATLKLVLMQNGAETDKEFEVNGRMVIGRFSPDTGPVDIDLSGFQGQEYISRHHAEIFIDGDMWKIRDLGSSNGTWLNSNKLTPNDPQTLKNGDVINFATIKFVVKI